MKLTMVVQGRKMLVLVGLLAVLVLWVYYAYILTPLVQRVWQVGGEARTLRGQLRAIEQAIVQEPQLRQQHRQLADEVEKLRTTLPSEEELPAVIERLADLASQTGVKLQLITPQRPLQGHGIGAGPTPSAPTTSPALYKEIPIDMEALAGFHQLGTFLSRIELGEQPMQLRSLHISQDAKMLRRHVVKMTLVAYVAPRAADKSLSRGREGS